MQREIRETEDGSFTLYVPGLNEHYHSINGAIAESQHVFIDAAFSFCKKREVRILEIGFGTGLNALLSFVAAKKENRKLYYHAVEKYPLTKDEVLKLNYDLILDSPGISMLDLHSTDWEVDCRINSGFILRKEAADIRKIKAVGPFDVIYFDAFTPDAQPELWTEEIFEKIFKLTAAEGILTTYSAKGDVRRALISAGFKVVKIPGPFGKRHILRALKNIQLT